MIQKAYCYSCKQDAKVKRRVMKKQGFDKLTGNLHTSDCSYLLFL